MNANLHIWLYLAQFFLEWEMFRTEVVEKIGTHILCPITFFFQKLYRLRDIVEKYCRARQATDDNIAHAYCMLVTWGYKHTLRICNNCFSTTVRVVRTRPSVTFYVYCLSYFIGVALIPKLGVRVSVRSSHCCSAVFWTTGGESMTHGPTGRCQLQIKSVQWPWRGLRRRS